MNTLSLFPTLLSLSFLAPLLLRVTIGLVSIIAGVSRFRKPYKYLSVLHVALGVFLMIGLYTQGAVIAGLILLGIEFLIQRKAGEVNFERLVLMTLFKVILLSLLVTGPGAFAFDLPL